MWWRWLRRLKGPRPVRLLLQWHITERCNLACSHCYQQAPLPAELPFDALLGVLRQFEALLEGHAGQVTVTGGEPYVRRDFHDLLGAIARRPLLGFAILTNGTAIDRAEARRLRRLGPQFVQLSVEGTRPTHDRIRGEGNFDLVVAAARELVAQRVTTFLSFTAHSSNFREFPEVARLGAELEVQRVWTDRMVPLGRGAALQPLTPEETREYLEIVSEARGNARPSPVAMHRALQFQRGGRPYRCAAGDTLITIQPNGDLYPCRRMPIRAGNVLETPLDELYRTSPLLQSLRDRSRVPEACRKCPSATVCGGGLRCLAYAVTGDPFQADPGCPLVSG